MQISTKLNDLAVAAAEGVSNAVGEAWGQLRLRMEAARGAAGRRRRMRVVESLALGGRRQLLLVRCDEQEYLVGTGPDSVETIVLRQPGVAAEAGATIPAGPGQAGTGHSTAAQAARTARSAGAGLTRPGAIHRERSANGPWLVTAPEMGATARNRVREAETGQGRKSWK